jgi:glyoxylase-like metal-dependent hydrolase (beta-lactamase superfamily II)
MVRSLTNAQVMIGDGDEDALEDRTGIRAELMLRHGDVIGACGNVEIIHVPGHSSGNLCLYLQKYKAIIAGDTIFGENKDYPHIFPPPEKYTSDVDSARNNLKILLDYDFDILLLTHGRNILKGAKKIVRDMLVREKIL